jgi:hypothetical protein
MSDAFNKEGPMGRRNHYPKKARRSKTSVLATIVAALLSRRHYGHSYRKPSLKRSLISFVLNRLARRFG